MATDFTFLHLLQDGYHGVILTDDHGRVVLLNLSAEQFLLRYGARRPQPGSDRNEWATGALRHVVGQACTGHHEVRAVDSPDGAGRAVVLSRVELEQPLSNGASAALIIIDLNEIATPCADVAGSVFGLTKSEACLAVKLAAGLSLEEIAAERGISVKTARTQLKTVFSKTETHRQPELVALLMRLSILGFAKASAGADRAQGAGSKARTPLPPSAGRGQPRYRGPVSFMLG